MVARRLAFENDALIDSDVSTFEVPSLGLMGASTPSACLSFGHFDFPKRSWLLKKPLYCHVTPQVLVASEPVKVHVSH
jgi:hypothetical protein